MNKLRLLLLTLCWLMPFISPVQAKTDDAQQLFNSRQPALFQIRLIENNAGNKSAIGSGFQISPDGIIATNYHVISGYVQHPDNYHLEFMDNEGNTGPLKVLDIDVINDLALVKRETDNSDFFPITKVQPAQGEQVFSLGNPHDLGMIVVPGTYNGLKEHSFYQRVHFTGSVNPGMSGGPAINTAGEVVGINVSTAGNQIAFLVPHFKLTALVEQFEQRTPDAPSDFSARIQSQLQSNQQRLMEQILNADWQPRPMGNIKVPDKISPFIPCWGQSNADKKNASFFSVVTNCSMSEQIYLENHFRSGNVAIQYQWIKSDELNRFRFYNVYEQQISRAGADNMANQENVTEFSCMQDVVSHQVNDIKTKSVLCTRAYKKYEGLFDVMYISASIDKAQQGLISHFTLAGIEQSLALKFTQKFMESVEWK